VFLTISVLSSQKLLYLVIYGGDATLFAILLYQYSLFISDL